jgi:hypothetical protein
VHRVRPKLKLGGRRWHGDRAVGSPGGSLERAVSIFEA